MDLLIDGLISSLNNLFQIALNNESLENSNITHNNPEYMDRQIIEPLLKEWALQNIFPEDVAQAHREGLLHIHDLGFPWRFYCSSHSLDYIKKYGLDLLALTNKSKPAKHLMSLIGQLNTFLSVIQSYFAGALGIGYLNVFMAPYAASLSDTELRQLMQYMWFSGAQNAYSRAAQTLFQDFNIHDSVPKYLRDVDAIGPGGKVVGKYKDYEKECRRMMDAILDIIWEGDADGRPFAFPKFNYHVTRETFDDPESYKLFLKACKVASHNGSVYFVFDRSGTQLAACCRLRWNVPEEYFHNTTLLRFVGLQNVTINLPQIILRYGENWQEGLRHAVKLVCKAHRAKMGFLWSLRDSVLEEMFRTHKDGHPYVDLQNRTTYIVGCVGLAEALRLLGLDIHTDEGQKAGLKIISTLYLLSKKYSNGITLVMEESPAESASVRLAKIDSQQFPEIEKVLYINDPPIYTNSIHLPPDSHFDVLARLMVQSKYHWMFEAGAIVHGWIGEFRPHYMSIANLIKKLYYSTRCAQFVLSPDFTDCISCGRVDIGFHERCRFCGSTQVDYISRIVGYYSKVSRWNKGKRSEFIYRRRSRIN